MRFPILLIIVLALWILPTYGQTSTAPSSAATKQSGTAAASTAVLDLLNRLDLAAQLGVGLQQYDGVLLEVVPKAQRYFARIPEGQLKQEMSDSLKAFVDLSKVRKILLSKDAVAIHGVKDYLVKEYKIDESIAMMGSENLIMPTIYAYAHNHFVIASEIARGVKTVRPKVVENSPTTVPPINQIDLEGLKKLLTRDANDTRPLLVNFWATWCDPCREEFPDLVKIDEDYRAKKNLNFVTVSLDDVAEINAEVPKFLKEMKATMPTVLLNVPDPEPAIKAVDATWTGQLPATFLYDKDGKVVFRHFGRIKPDELRAAIDKAVSRKQ